jgi:ATP-dependent Clp protease ATP-binding subunit ClpX
MFDLPGLKNVKEITVSKDVVTGKAKPICTYHDKDSELNIASA